MGELDLLKNFVSLLFTVREKQSQKTQLAPLKMSLIPVFIFLKKTEEVALFGINFIFRFA